MKVINFMKRGFKLRHLPIGLLCLLPLAVSAQTTSLFMPEGSKDLYLGATYVNVPRAEGSQDRRGILIPTASVQWSNGIYLDTNELGLNLSPAPNVRLGPFISPSFSSVREQQSDGSTKEKLKFSAEFGGFYSYRVAHNISANANIIFGAGDDRKGIVSNFALNFSTPVAPHHFIGLSVGFTLANQKYMQSQFGVSAESAAAEHIDAFRASAGMKNLFVGSNWNWELNHKWSLTTGINIKHYLGSAAESPWVKQHNDTSFVSSLNYHY
jgi:outer membrane scaffolding protein for murein synthesis (MipA/OmpV family)